MKGRHLTTLNIASPANQALVLQSTFKKLAEKHWSGVVFEAFSETWKPGSEGLFGSFWGICQGEPPFACTPQINQASE